MKLTKLAVIFSLAVGMASAASTYTLNLTSTTNIAGTELKPGTYKLELAADKLLIKFEGKSLSVPVTVETGAIPYHDTMLGATNSVVTDIRLGGSKLKVVFPTVSPAGAAQ